MSKHTPGPWWYGISCEPERGPVQLTYESPGYYENTAIFGADGTEVVGCTEYSVFSDNPADISLMLAAPDLLESLREILKDAELAGEKTSLEAIDFHLESIRQVARAAIAKAEGSA